MPEDEQVKVLCISNHQRNWINRTIHHTATAVIKNYTPEQKDKATSQVSIAAGYHPCGYGLDHRFTKIEPTENENEYLVSWQTADSCD